MGDAKETAFPAESEPSGSPPRRAPTARFGLTGDYGERGGRGEERWRGKGILFLPLPVQGEANLRWQSLKKLRKVWVAQLVVEAQGKQAVLGGGGRGARWVLLGVQVWRQLKIQVSWVRSTHGPKSFSGPVPVESLRSFHQKTDKAEPRVRRFCAEVESTTRDSSEQQWERLICQGRIRSTGSGSPTFPRPERDTHQRSVGRCAQFRFALWVSAHHVRPRP